MLVSTSNASSKHPQVCTPAFDGCPVEVYVMSARRIKGFHQEAGGYSRSAKGSSDGICTCKSTVSTLIAKVVERKCGSVEQGQTRLKLKARVSTLYIQVEECLSVSCFHHSAEGGGRVVGGAIPLEKLCQAGEAGCAEGRDTEALLATCAWIKL